MATDRYKHNAGAVFSLKYHLVWCPKYRKKVLTGPVEARLKELLASKAEEMGATIHALEVMPDHVHLFVESDPTKARRMSQPNSKASPRASCGKSSGT